MRHLKTILFLSLIIILVSCNNSKKRKNAENQVTKFYAAIKEGSEKKMLALYADVATLSSYYKSDTASIKDSKILKNDEIQVTTLNTFTNGYGKKFNQEIIFYLKPDPINKLDYFIYDSKGLCGYDDNTTYLFGNKTGCISKSDVTDQQIAKKMKIADELLMIKGVDVYRNLKENIQVVSWSWESGYAGSASGRGIVNNSSTFVLPELKYKITYKDIDGNQITTYDGYITYEKLNPGESKSFTFYTSYAGNAKRAFIDLVFDDKMIMDYVAGLDYTGKEYQTYMATRDTTSNK